MPTIPNPARDAILDWYGTCGRPLAFRRTRDPYAVLVSEAMAQQTQAARAAVHWERFMDRFPTVERLARAPIADVLRAWKGLGYDRRALALHRAARVIVDEHDGRVPSDLAALQALPGVGPYTARAVAAIAFGSPIGAVDVNVRRVLGRIAAGSIEALTTAEVQALADDAVAPDRPADWTHALMDVGATLCRPRAPRCDDCPARPWCRAASAGVPTSIRLSRPGTPFPMTTRWLRGRILDRLRAAPDGVWTDFDKGIGDHDVAKVHLAARAMAADGVIELETGIAGDVGSIRARLPTG